MKSLLASFCLVSLLSTAAGFHWKECGKGQTSISEVSLSPDPPVPGATANFGIKGDSGVEIDSGTLSLAVAFMGFPIWSETKNLCERTECPVKKGPVQLSVSEYLPPITPPGAYNITITAQTEANVQLLCLQVDFEIKPPAPPAEDGSIKGQVQELEMSIESEEAAQQVKEVQASRMRQVQIS